MLGYEAVVRRTYRAPRTRVFAAWTEPAAIKQWFTPMEAVIESAENDLRVGGTFRIVMVTPDGEKFGGGGVYDTVEPPAKLRLSWMWDESKLQPDESQLTVEFIDLGESTEIVLTHAKLSSEGSASSHTAGWTGCLEGMERYLASQG